MKYFKLKQGLENSTYLTAENYEMKLKELPREEQKKYSENKEDNSGKRYFAICPACDNTTQIIGLYSKSDNIKLPYNPDCSARHKVLAGSQGVEGSQHPNRSFKNWLTEMCISHAIQDF